MNKNLESRVAWKLKTLVLSAACLTDLRIKISRARRWRGVSAVSGKDITIEMNRTSGYPKKWDIMNLSEIIKNLAWDTMISLKITRPKTWDWMTLDNLIKIPILDTTKSIFKMSSHRWHLISTWILLLSIGSREFLIFQQVSQPSKSLQDQQLLSILTLLFIFLIPRLPLSRLLLPSIIFKIFCLTQSCQQVNQRNPMALISSWEST